MILLDSQAALWAVDGSPRLGRQARASITASAPVHYSAATIFELSIKSMLGRLDVPPDIRERFEGQGLIELAVSARHAAAIREFPELTRHDPFDRLIVAQASCTGLQLLTADRVLLGLGRDFIVDATV